MTVFEAFAGIRTPRVRVTAHRSWSADRARATSTFDALAGAAASIAAAAAAGHLDADGLSVAGMGLVAVGTLGWPLICAASGAYGRNVLGSPVAEGARLLHALGGVLALLGALAYVLDAAPPREAVGAGLPVLVAAALTGRLAVNRLLRAKVRRLLLVGPEGRVREAAARLASSPRYGSVVAGIAAEPDGGDLLLSEGAPLLRDITRLETAIDLVDADTVLVVAGTLTPEEMRNLAWQLEARGVELALLPGLLDVEAARLSVRVEDGLPVLAVAPPMRDGLVVGIKHAADRVLAAGLLVAALPLMAAIVAAVRATSSGPAIFRQVRIGKDGRPFVLFKFRTMVAGAESQRERLAAANDADGPLFKLRKDPRVTPVGRFLRKHSLDELPQLFNVVRGEMSLVGPRPPLPAEVAAYSSEVSRRLMVRPGITGLWQVSGRSDLSWEDSVRLDLRYVDNVSLKRDADILRRTVGTVISGGGAY